MLVAESCLQVAAAVGAYIAALTLFYGSLGIPPEMQTWDGTSAREQALRARQTAMKWVGIPAATLAVACQLALIFWQAN